jgi:hypothetical protein
MFLRPEEVHRASGEDDVVPPLRSRDQAVEDLTLGIRALVVYVDGDGIPAIGAGSLNAAVDVERRADPKRIPSTVRVPPPVERQHAIGSRNGREWIRHAQSSVAGVEDERMLVVKLTPTLLDLSGRPLRSPGNFLDRRSAPHLGEQPVRQVPKMNLGIIHTAFLRKTG